MLKPSITFVICRRGRVLRRETYCRALIRIGRHRSNHLQLEDEAVSKRHAVIEVTPERVTLVDLAEEPGVRVNGQWIDEAALRVGDRIQIGTTEIVLEEVAMIDTSSERAAPGGDLERAIAEQREAEATPPAALAAASSGLPAPPAYTYALLRTGPALRTEEVELAHVLSTEVSILWGENVLHVAHLAAGQSFSVGEEQGAGQRCDFLIPREKLGVSRMPLVIGRGSRFALVIAAHARGHVISSDGALHALEAVRASAEACPALPGARQLQLTLGTRAELSFGDIVIRIAAVRAGKPVGHGLAAGLDTGALPYFALSALSFGGLLSSMAFLVPPLALLADEDADDDRLYLLQAYLAAAAEREHERTPGAQSSSPEAPIESGARAAGQEGALG
jgi:pSer/pThr/pTyr-binding forkhead associated (FHA) protein